MTIFFDSVLIQGKKEKFAGKRKNAMDHGPINEGKKPNCKKGTRSIFLGFKFIRAEAGGKKGESAIAGMGRSLVF